MPVLDGPITRIAASSTHAAAVRGGEVWILRDDGTVVGRLADRDRTRESAPDARGGARQAEAVLDVAGVSEFDRDSDWAFDLIDNERTLAQRRGARQRPAPASEEMRSPLPVLAASRADLWIARGPAWLRVDAAGRLLHVPGGEVPRAWAAADGRLLVARPGGLALRSPTHESERWLPLPSAPDQVAISESGSRWAWSGAAGIGWTDGPGTATLPSRASAVALAYCGETLLIVWPDALVVVAPGTAPETRARDRHVSRVLCPAGGVAPWVALGEELSASLDRGQTWTPIATPPGDVLVDVAATAHHLWLATRSGLYVSAETPTAVPTPPPAPAPRPAQRRQPNTWWTWLPQVSLYATATAGPREHALEGLALAQFALDRPVPVRVASSERVADVPATRSERASDRRDPDAECLARARRRAVEAAMADPGRAQSYVNRAGRAAWLPELRVLVSRRYGRSESLDVSGSSTALSSPLGIDTVNDIRYEARATWDLAKLVFSAEELAAQNQALHMAELRRDLETTVNRLYFERRRLALENGNGWAQQLRQSEIEAELDALSGGAFGACVAENARPQASPSQ